MAQAHYLVAEKADGWFILMEGERYGPFPNGRTGALIAAVQAAQQAGKDGHESRVQVRARDGTLRIAWRFGNDGYPPVWVEDLRSEMQETRSARELRRSQNPKAGLDAQGLPRPEHTVRTGGARC